MPRSSNAEFDENGFAEVIRDIEELFAREQDSADLNAAAQPVDQEFIDGGGGAQVGGDIAGKLKDATVGRLQGRPISAAAPANGDALVFDGTNALWKPGAISTSTITGSLAGDVQGALNATTVVGLQGVSITPDAPTDGQYLRYVLAEDMWVPYAAPARTYDTVVYNSTGFANDGVQHQFSADHCSGSLGGSVSGGDYIVPATADYRFDATFNINTTGTGFVGGPFFVLNDIAMSAINTNGGATIGSVRTTIMWYYTLGLTWPVGRAFLVISGIIGATAGDGIRAYITNSDTSGVVSSVGAIGTMSVERLTD